MGSKQPICPGICQSVWLPDWLSTGVSVSPYVMHVSLIKPQTRMAGAACSVKVETIDRERRCSEFNDPL